jgi:hypothetical protein
MRMGLVVFAAMALLLAAIALLIVTFTEDETAPNVVERNWF